MADDKRQFIDRVRHALNKELIKRSLIRYFTQKGFENFNSLIYAPVLQDLPLRIPELINKLEIVPYVKELNPATGQAVIGWNLYVLGNHRMDLGETSHNNMNDFQRSVQGPTPYSVATNQKTPKEVVDFILKILGANKSGMIRPQPVTSIPPTNNTGGPAPGAIANRPRMGPTMSGGYYEKNKPAG